MINWLDFKSIKRGVKLESVLRYYHVELRRSGKDQYRGCCPIHRGDGRDAFHVNLARNVFHCFACGAGGTVLDFMAAMERCSLYDAAQKLQDVAGWSGQPRLIRDETELVTERRRVSLPLNFKLAGIDCTHPYLADRGITEKTALEFGVGFYAGPGLMHGRLVIPIHNADGQLIAYCGRSVDQTPPRYRVPPGFAKSAVLFNMHRAAATEESAVVVVEGFFDCMQVHQAGIRSVVALMGAVLYEPQRCALGRFRQVILSWTATSPAERQAKSSPKSCDPSPRCKSLNCPSAPSPTSCRQRRSERF